MAAPGEGVTSGGAHPRAPGQPQPMAAVCVRACACAWPGPKVSSHMELGCNGLEETKQQMSWSAMCSMQAGHQCMRARCDGCSMGCGRRVAPRQPFCSLHPLSSQLPMQLVMDCAGIRGAMLWQADGQTQPDPCLPSPCCQPCSTGAELSETCEHIKSFRVNIFSERRQVYLAGWQAALLPWEAKASWVGPCRPAPPRAGTSATELEQRPAGCSTQGPGSPPGPPPPCGPCRVGKGSQGLL